MDNKIEWGIVTMDCGVISDFKEGELVKLYRHPQKPLGIWGVESYTGDSSLAAFIYYEPFEFSSEEEREMYRMLYPNWSDDI